MQSYDFEYSYEIQIFQNLKHKWIASMYFHSELWPRSNHKNGVTPRPQRDPVSELSLIDPDLYHN